MRASKGTSRSPPIGRTLFSSRARNNLACIEKGISPISSKSKVPPSACTNNPLRSVRASVKAPLTWPNSSLSKSASGKAAQLMATNGRSRRAAVVQGLGHEFLARAAFARDQYRDLRIGDLGELVVEFSHRQAFAEQFLEPRRTSHRFAERTDLLLKLPALDGAAQDDGQQFHFDRLGDEIVRPGPNRRDRRLQAAERRHHDHRNRRPIGRQPLAELDAVGPGHFEVGQHDIETVAGKGGESLGGRSEAGRSEVAQPQIGLQQVAHAPLVVDDQHFGLHDPAPAGK